jgi:hypothetical protein
VVGPKHKVMESLVLETRPVLRVQLNSSLDFVVVMVPAAFTVRVVWQVKVVEDARDCLPFVLSSANPVEDTAR